MPFLFVTAMDSNSHPKAVKKNIVTFLKAIFKNSWGTVTRQLILRIESRIVLMFTPENL